jgi:hypothetical protein
LKNRRMLVGMSALLFDRLTPPMPWHGRWFWDLNNIHVYTNTRIYA